MRARTNELRTFCELGHATGLQRRRSEAMNRPHSDVPLQRVAGLFAICDDSAAVPLTWSFTTIAASSSVDGKPRSRASQRAEARTIVKPDMGRSCKERWDDHASCNGTIRRFELG